MAWLGVVAAVGLAALVGREVWRRRTRRRFFGKRQSLTDAAFCQAVSASAEVERCWVELRHALAAQCGLPPEAVCPDDGLDTLEALTFDGWDFHDLLCTLEERLNIPIRRLSEEHTSRAEGPETVRGLGECLVETLRASPPSREEGGRTG